jgi:hypothetical protein
MGYESYPFYEGMLWNIENFELAVGYTFICYGFFWTIFLLYFGRIWTPVSNSNHGFNFILKTSGISMFLIFFASFIGGQLSEIRLLFLSFPWAFTIVLAYINEKKTRLWNLIINVRFIVFSLIIAILSYFMTSFLLENRMKIFGGSQFKIPFSIWIITGMVVVYFFLISLPLILKTRKQ